MGNNRSKVPDLEKLVKGGRKKFVRYEEGAMLYSMGVHTFQQLAKDARAVYQVKRIVLVNLDHIDEYLEGKKRRFVNYTQGAKIYKMSYWPFVRLAKKAEANYPIRKTAIVDLNILDDFLEGNPEVVSELKKRRRKRYGK